MDIVVIGSKGGETKIVLDDGSGLQSRFLNMIWVQKVLGNRAEQIIAEDRNTAQEQRQRLAEAEKQLREAEKLGAESKKRSTRDTRSGKRSQASIDAIQEQQGSNLQSEAELRRWKQLKKKIIKPNLQIRNENCPCLKNKQKTKKKLQEKVHREKKKVSEIEREKNIKEERLNITKRFDELNEDESRLKRLNEKD